MDLDNKNPASKRASCYRMRHLACFHRECSQTPSLGPTDRCKWCLHAAEQLLPHPGLITLDTGAIYILPSPSREGKACATDSPAPMPDPTPKNMWLPLYVRATDVQRRTRVRHNP